MRKNRKIYEYKCIKNTNKRDTSHQSFSISSWWIRVCKIESIRQTLQRVYPDRHWLRSSLTWACKERSTEMLFWQMLLLKPCHFYEGSYFKIETLHNWSPVVYVRSESWRIRLYWNELSHIQNDGSRFWLSGRIIFSGPSGWHKLIRLAKPQEGIGIE